ncbi:DHA2 family efflux MFS transporter permease subunit [Nocardia sp. CDC159]|uniref:DHA2 family efflux MFS transporter permease subunit n=1 Tax=Nocardia pulmonis TaxID=2951408 RepID=A0A9X2J293_9NOCA|nr:MULTISPECIES: DHA2 family efflux MFS transporter permease subunit [Nocardia]MCM6778930.1 DHA2 family efflux MFS transporter permease subunit [Nocardia pulmonis]MCM6791817.1 DHA2 family efflux MFS transporter permease subunit [Nocardia sp. CDC159]
MTGRRNPWPALYALVFGFFMILLDLTIVAVANPKILSDLHTDITKVIWVTSAYLLAYAVPLLVTGRLGDRFGPKYIYLAGLTVFTLASLWCGMSTSIEMLIAARVVQGLGAALMTPQAMAVITRTFPPDKRGAAMGILGAVTGLATLAGPLLGGVLVDKLGWNWIFYINVPIGVVAFGLALWLVPALETHAHKFDLIGVALSGIGMFLLVFGIQEGKTRNWDGVIWAMIVGGLAVLALFVVNQGRNTGEPLVPLSLFRDRDFALSCLALMAAGAATAALMVPAYFYLQSVRDYSSTESALVFAPMALMTGIGAPILGKLADRTSPRLVLTVSFGLYAISVFWFVALLKPDSSIPVFMLAAALAGIANAGIWGPLAATATRNLPTRQAGAGAGVYNTTRQVGMVLGSATISALLSARMSAQGLDGAAAGNGTGPVAAQILDKLSTALGESMILPGALLLIGVLATALFATARGPRPTPTPAEHAVGDGGHRMFDE